MHPYLQVILWAAGIVVLFIILMAWNNHKWKKAQKNRIKRIFGKIPEREYSPDDLERISHYFRRKENGKFKSIEELKSVNGIGENKYEEIKKYIYV